MSNLSNCPDCSAYLNPRAKRCACGWKPPEPAVAASSSGKPAKAVDPDHGRCQHVEPMGERCRAPGAVSLLGGPWLCWPHATPTWQRFNKGAIPESFKRAKEALQESVKRRTEPLDYEAELERAAIQNEGPKR